MNPPAFLITNSRAKTFNACRRLHLIQYIEGYRPVERSEASQFGDVFHAAQQAWLLAHKDGLPGRALVDAEAAIVANARDMDAAAIVKLDILMAGYDAYWSPEMEQWEVIAVEAEFRAPLRHPGSSRPCGWARAAGKIDAIFRRRSDGTYWLVEHKTTSSNLSVGSSYWLRLRMDSQVSIYFDGAEALGIGDIAGCIYDVIVRPNEKPYSATPEEKRKYTKDGRLYANQRDRDETIPEFRVRIADEIIKAPHMYFARTEVIRLPSELHEARRDLYMIASGIKADIATREAPRNTDACFKFGGNAPCAFVDVCSGAASLDDESRFVRLDNVHPELSDD